MKRFNWQTLLGFGLITLSALLYFLHYTIFRDTHHIFIYLLGDVAFVPIEVLLVTLIIHRLLTAREKRSMLKKLNMVIGAFFSEVGTELLRLLSVSDVHSEKIRNGLIMDKNWSRREFSHIKRRIKHREHTLDIRAENLTQLRDFLITRRNFLLRLLENPNLLEHETFTDLLWAISHLAEELSHRKGFDGLPDTDLEHLAGDVKRAYGQLITEWLDYMKHLSVNYPYLFSLAMRTNPFDMKASVVFK